MTIFSVPNPHPSCAFRWRGVLLAHPVRLREELNPGERRSATHLLGIQTPRYVMLPVLNPALPGGAHVRASSGSSAISATVSHGTALRASTATYSPKCSMARQGPPRSYENELPQRLFFHQCREGEFCELRNDGVLGS